VTRSASTQRRILDLPRRPDGGLGETGPPSVSPNVTAQARRDVLATLHQLIETLAELSNTDTTVPSERPQSDSPLLLDAAEAGRLLSISRVTVLDLATRAEIPSIRVGRSVRIPRDLLVTWIAQNSKGGAGTAAPRLPNWAYVDRSEEL